jgi:hypothetical protein
VRLENAPKSTNLYVDDISAAMAALHPNVDINQWPFLVPPGPMRDSLHRYIIARRLEGPQPRPVYQMPQSYFTGPVPGYTTFEVPFPMIKARPR